MKHSSRTLAVSSFSESTHHRLNMYVLAASAAGVGALALSSPAEAKIIYTSVNTPLAGYRLDLNHDGITDFYFRGYGFCNTNACVSLVNVYSVFPPNAVAGKSNNAAPLWPGVEIGSKRRFEHGRSLAIELVARHYHTGNHTSTTTFSGPWANGGKGFKNHYLGLKFSINSKVHYGWARVTTDNRVGGAVLTGYAYETIPGKAISAGQTKGTSDDRDFVNSRDLEADALLSQPVPDQRQPASLGVLALGAQSVPPWRRQSSAHLTLIVEPAK